MQELKVGAYMFVGIVVIAIASLLLKVFLFPATVAHTAMNSVTGIVSKTLDSNNVIASYEWYHDNNAQYEARIGQIKSHRHLIEGEADSKEKSRLNIELSAMQQSCRDMATKYNANSQKVNKSLFKGGSLPEVLSTAKCEA